MGVICILFDRDWNCDQRYNKLQIKGTQQKYAKYMTSNAFNCLAFHSIHITDIDKSMISFKNKHEKQHLGRLLLFFSFFSCFCDGYTQLGH